MCVHDFKSSRCARCAHCWSLKKLQSFIIKKGIGFKLRS
uniref:Uncharacterized protein n=1 Tax=Arundo donax TaxID=35708 RepID=A0A0A9LN81_ARUDO